MKAASWTVVASLRAFAAAGHHFSEVCYRHGEELPRGFVAAGQPACGVVSVSAHLGRSSLRDRLRRRWLVREALVAGVSERSLLIKTTGRFKSWAAWLQELGGLAFSPLSAETCCLSPRARSSFGHFGKSLFPICQHLHCSWCTIASTALAAQRAEEQT